MFVIEDELHAEWIGEFSTYEEVLAEVRRLANVPWNQRPNCAPCMSWRTCGRDYWLLEYDETQLPWTQVRRVRVLEVSAEGVRWADGFQDEAGPSHSAADTGSSAAL